MISLTKYEMETTVNFNAKEGTAILYTRDKVVMRRIDKLVAEFPDIYKLENETEIDKTYSFPKKYAFPRRPRIMSEEQREKMRVRLAKAREGQQDDDELLDDEEDELLDDEEDELLDDEELIEDEESEDC